MKMKINIKNIIKLTILSSIPMVLISCAHNNKELPYQGKSAEFIYKIGHTQMQDESYPKAIRSFKSLLSQYPFHKITEKGLIDMIYVYFMKDDLPLSIAVCNQFIKHYPDSKNIGYVYYMLGVMQYNNGRGFLQNYLSYDMKYHDISPVKIAFYNLEKSMSFDKNSKFAADANRRMAYIDQLVADYLYEIAEFNFEHYAYAGALHRLNEIVQKHPRTTATEKALILMIKSYDILGGSDENIAKLSNDAYEILKLNFPESDFFKENKTS